MNRTDALDALREALADNERLAIAATVLPPLARAIRKLLPPSGEVTASINPDAVWDNITLELDGEPAQLSPTGRTVERARIEAIFRRACEAYALANAVNVQARILSGDAEPGPDDVYDAVELFGRGNGTEVDISDYQPLPESLEPLPQAGDEDDGEDDADATQVQP